MTDTKYKIQKFSSFFNYFIFLNELIALLYKTKQCIRSFNTSRNYKIMLFSYVKFSSVVLKPGQGTSSDYCNFSNVSFLEFNMS